jgi:uncharacterized cofD-like protein
MGDPFKYDPSMTASFKAISDDEPRPNMDKLNVVVIGGGTGTNTSIRTLLSMGTQVSAVVAMADDGGSTGIIRQEAHVTPPGDVRKCIGAMAADQDDPMTHAFKYRFEFARNHTLGNLMLSALEHETGSFVEAIAICERLLKARGHTYPSTLDNVYLSAYDVEGNLIKGQANASHSEHALKKVWLDSEETCRPYSKALDAIRQADAIVLGPGSLFTSIIPNLLVPGVTQAIRQSGAFTLFICNMADVQGETRGMRSRDYIKALIDHGMDGLIDYVLLHSSTPLTSEAEEAARYELVSAAHAVRPVPVSFEDVRWIESIGAGVQVRNFYNPDAPQCITRFAAQALTEIFEKCLSPQM